MTKAHCFAIYYAQLPTGNTISDKTLIQRLIRVLRIQPDEEFILFNQQEHIYCSLVTADQKSMTLRIIKKEKNTILTPHITVLLPVLKRAALEEALYLVTELGAQEIQLITTDKTTKQQSLDIERAQRIVIAAAEQSKQFAFPQVIQPIPLDTALKNCKKPLLIADIQGKSIGTYIPLLKKQTALTLLVGPEGDFSQSEYELFARIADNGYHCTLTPTILRSEHAIALLVGIVRSML